MRQLPLLLMLTPLAVLAQGTSELRGRVVNEAGLPITGATITLAAVGYSIRTDSAGWFVLSGTPGAKLVFALGGIGAPPEYQSMNGSCGVVLIWTK